MTDPFTVLGLERGDLLAAAGCLHRYRQPHMVALVARLSEAEHRGTLAQNHAPNATECPPVDQDGSTRGNGRTNIEAVRTAHRAAEGHACTHHWQDTGNPGTRYCTRCGTEWTEAGT